MAEAYPEVLRARVVQAYEMGEGSYATIATQWHLGTATVKRWVAQQRREGHVRSCPKAGGTTSRITAADIEALLVALGDLTVKRWGAGREGHVRSCPKAGGTTSRITAADIEALLVALGDPAAGELTATYNRLRRGRGRVHVSSMKRALHRHDYVVTKNGGGRRRWRGQPSGPIGVGS